MVGHGGGGGIRRAILWCSKLLFSIGFDAPGNVARAIYHGVAVKTGFKTSSAAELKAAIDKLLGGPSIQKQHDAFKTICGTSGTDAECSDYRACVEADRIFMTLPEMLPPYFEWLTQSFPNE